MKSIQEIREEFKKAAPEDLPALCQVYREDSRKGVQNLLVQAEKRQARKARVERFAYFCGFNHEFVSLNYS